LLAAPAVDGVVVGGGAAAAIRGAGLAALLPLVEEAQTETGLLLMAPRAVCETVGVLDADMDDGADLALLHFALRGKAAGIALRVVEERPPLRSTSVDCVAPRKAFARRWLSNECDLADRGDHQRSLLAQRLTSCLLIASKDS
jgi:hypothetical protein